MKKSATLIVLLLAYTIAISQTYKYFFDNSLTFKNQQGQNIPFPFTGGLISPQFSNIDLNGDGAQDLFIFDRFNNKVLTFVHSGAHNAEEWIYSPQYELVFPYMHHWALLADYNGDGKKDLFTSALQSVNAIRVFKNVSTGNEPAFQLVTEALTAKPINPNAMEGAIFCVSVDIPAIEDIDGDGDLDILTTSPNNSSLEFYRNDTKNDVIRFVAKDMCWGNYGETQSRKLNLGLDCWFGRLQGAGHAGTALLLLDMDNDKDKDLIFGESDYSELTLMMNGKNDFSGKFDSIISYDTVFPRGTTHVNMPFFLASYYVDVNNDGVKDLIVAPNTKIAGKSLNQIYYYRNTGANAMPNFSFVKNNFLQELTVDFGADASPAFVDVDGDADLDLIVAHNGDYVETQNGAARLALFKNTGTTSKPQFQLENNADYLGIIKDSVKGMRITFGDLNGDGFADMVAGDNEGELWYYQNTGNLQLSLAPPVKKYMGIDVDFSSVPQVIDLDEDSLPDIVTGSGTGKLQFFKNKGTKTSPAFDNFPAIDSLGGVDVKRTYYEYLYDSTFINIVDSVLKSDATGNARPYFTDLNEDGKLELLVGSLSGKLWLFNTIENNLSGTFTEVKSFVYSTIANRTSPVNFGGNISPIAVKLSDTGKPAIFIGNARGGINYLKSDSGVVTGIVRIETKAFHLTIYPNPSKGEIWLERNLDEYSGPVTVEVTDALGRVVYASYIEKETAEYNLNITATPGVYYVRLSGANAPYATQKLIIVR